jgi:hypothetical protein
LWQFTVGPLKYGLVNFKLPAAFTGVMHLALPVGDALNLHALVYIHDVLPVVLSKAIEQHDFDFEHVPAGLIQSSLEHFCGESSNLSIRA